MTSNIALKKLICNSPKLISTISATQPLILNTFEQDSFQSFSKKHFSHTLFNSDIQDWLISCRIHRAVVSEDLATHKTYSLSCSMTWHGSLNLYHLHVPIRTANVAQSALSPVTNGLLVSQSDKIALAMAESAQYRFRYPALRSKFFRATPSEG